jgi:hypothetical protein
MTDDDDDAPVDLWILNHVAESSEQLICDNGIAQIMSSFTRLNDAKVSISTLGA